MESSQSANGSPRASIISRRQMSGEPPPPDEPNESSRAGCCTAWPRRRATHQDATSETRAARRKLTKMTDKCRRGLAIERPSLTAIVVGLVLALFILHPLQIIPTSAAHSRGEPPQQHQQQQPARGGLQPASEVSSSQRKQSPPTLVVAGPQANQQREQTQKRPEQQPQQQQQQQRQQPQRLRDETLSSPLPPGTEAEELIEEGVARFQSTTPESSSLDENPDEEADSETGAEEGENAAEEHDETPPNQVGRREDSPVSSSPGPFEGIQVRPARRSQEDTTEASGVARGFTSTTLRTLGTTSDAAPSSQQPTRPIDSRAITQSSPKPRTLSGASFDVAMGADRMLIKPADELETRLLLSSSPSPLPVPFTSASSSGLGRARLPVASPTPPPDNNFHEFATESIQRQHRTPPASSGGFSARAAQNVSNWAAASEPAANPDQQFGDQVANVIATNDDHHNKQTAAGQSYGNQQQVFIGIDSQQQQELALSSASICYTPISLLVVIVATILITMFVTLGACFLFKYLKRHQFDLVANSKHFDHKHLSTSSNGYSQSNAGLSLGRRALGSGTATAVTSACPLHLFQADERCNKCRTAGDHQQVGGRLTGAGYAFRNPYFTDDQQQQHHQLRAAGLEPATSSTATTGLGQSGAPSPSGAGLSSAVSPGGTLLGMHFIESHIADLHNRQVTSSVNELSSLGAETAQVIDLTSQEQQARVRAHAKEGDLVAVDLTGHDIIGLGIDVCGNQRDGIFISTLNCHGPARESGCIQVGDRIKCINVSFENVTLQDACDMLNAAAPYKLRLLVEKKVASVAELAMMQRSSERPHWLPGEGEQRPQRFRMPRMAAANLGAGQFDVTSLRAGPLEATRNYLGRLTGLLLGTTTNEVQRQADVMQKQRLGVRQPHQMFSQEFHHRMAPTSNPLLMMNQTSRNLYRMGNPVEVDARLGSSSRLDDFDVSRFSLGDSAQRIQLEGGFSSTAPPSARPGQTPDQVVRRGSSSSETQALDAQRDRPEKGHTNCAFSDTELEVSDDVDRRIDKAHLAQGANKYLRDGSDANIANVICLNNGHHRDCDDKDDDDDDDDNQREQLPIADRHRDCQGQNKSAASGKTFSGTKSRLTM